MHCERLQTPGITIPIESMKWFSGYSGISRKSEGLQDGRLPKLGIEELELIEDLSRLNIDGRLPDCEVSFSDMSSTTMVLNEVLLEARLALGEIEDWLRPEATDPDRWEKYDGRRFPAAEILLCALAPRGSGLEGTSGGEMLPRRLAP